MQNFKKTLLLIIFFVLMTTFVMLRLVHHGRAASSVTSNSRKSKISCGRYPEEVIIDNTVWQVLETSKGLVNILNAYIDERPMLGTNSTVVRINVNSMELNGSDIFHCQFWYEDRTEPTVAKASEVLLMWGEIFGGLHAHHKMAYLIECPYQGTAPTSVSLVAEPCDEAKNHLKILNPKPMGGAKKRFGVCSKQADFENQNFTMRFIEWIHLARILGAEKIHFSYKNLHTDFKKIVRYFVDQGIVDAWQFDDPSGIDTTRSDGKQKCLVEMNTLTDCFYRVKNLYDFVAVLDFDEILFPVNEADMSWDDIIKRANSSTYRDAYVSSNVFYPDVEEQPLHKKIPSYMYMLQHTQRSQMFSLPGSSIKSFFGTERVKVLHNHAPHHCLNHKNKCDVIDLPPSISQNSHYRENTEKAYNKRTVEDKAIWKFKDNLIKAVQKTLDDTGFES